MNHKRSAEGEQIFGTVDKVEAQYLAEQSQAPIFIGQKSVVTEQFVTDAQGFVHRKDDPISSFSLEPLQGF